MTQEELFAFCRGLPGIYEDYPFGEEWAAFRHRCNRKTFVFVYARRGAVCLNLKCDPMQADFWRSVYTDVTPAYHMNKTHWNTVLLHGDVPDPELEGMLRHSYSLIAPKQRSHNKNRNSED